MERRDAEPLPLGGDHIVGVALDVLHVSAPFEHEDVEALFGEFLGSPPAADAAADDDGVVGACLLCFSVDVRHDDSEFVWVKCSISGKRKHCGMKTASFITFNLVQ